MILAKTIKTIEYDKILLALLNFAVMEQTKKEILEFNPVSELSDAEFLLEKTSEAYKLLYTYSVGGIFYSDDIRDSLRRAELGATFNNSELLKVADNLKTARILRTSISSVSDSSLTILPSIIAGIYVDGEFEKEIYSKIISENEVSDRASSKLASIRREIKSLNVKIRDQLNTYMRGSYGKYLQENVITLRQDRYVIPVKSEYRSFVKGFIHDQSASGSTVFIEPEMVMELNNELKRAYFDEQNEIYRILCELTDRVRQIVNALRSNYDLICQVDEAYAKASYAFSNKCTKPILNDKGIIDIKKGKHPLISKEKVVPVDVKLGKDYRFLLVTGPNTGGKTVCLKLVGLLTLMAMSGIYVPADEESTLSVFDGVYCDIGDEQSIEQSLSTFSSHIVNVKSILDNASKNSLILLDELGAGTDPEEGSALALAITKKMIDRNLCGIITTHYSKMKEFASINDKIANASMEFDNKTLKPLYRLNVGIPGSSNAIDIAKTLGVDEEIISLALSELSEEKIGFESVLKQAEEERRKYLDLSNEVNETLLKKKEELNLISIEKEKIIKEREKIYQTAKLETKRIVSDKLDEAEEIIDQLKDILRRTELESKEFFKASELKNRLKNSKYLENAIDHPTELNSVDINKLKKGDRVYVKSLGGYAIVDKIKKEKKEIEVLIGSIRTSVKLFDVFNNETIANEVKVQVSRKNISGIVVKEINILGKTSLEALDILEEFVSTSVMHGLEEIKIIHGVGTGVLIKTVREYLKNDKRVKEFRRGKYGEGENGVTIVTLK